MAAATVKVQKPIRQVGGYQEQITLSSLTAGQTETLTLLDTAPKVAPTEVTFTTTVEPTTGDPIFGSYLPASSTPSSRTLAVKLRTVAGGDVAAGEVTLNIKWTDASAGGIS